MSENFINIELMRGIERVLRRLDSPRELNERTADLLESLRLVIAKEGIRTAQAFLDLKDDVQPDELTRRRLLKSRLAEQIIVDFDDALTLGGVNKYLAGRIEIREGLCYVKSRPVGPVLPAPDSKPPR